ncbi:MAG: acyl-CoA thioesterase [Sandaracinaceae bacterium]
MLGFLTRTLPLAVRARMNANGELVSRLHRRVLPREVDLNLHMNQAVYAQVAELGRTDWMLRSTFWPHFRDQGTKPMVADQRIEYRKELRTFTAYEATTRATGMDGRLFVLETHLLVGERVHAKITGRLIFIGDDGVLSAEASRGLCERFVVAPLSVRDWKVEAR